MTSCYFVKGWRQVVSHWKREQWQNVGTHGHTQRYVLLGWLADKRARSAWLVASRPSARIGSTPGSKKPTSPGRSTRWSSPTKRMTSKSVGRNCKTKNSSAKKLSAESRRTGNYSLPSRTCYPRSITSYRLEMRARSNIFCLGWSVWRFIQIKPLLARWLYSVYLSQQIV